MRILIHDRDEAFDARMKEKFDRVIYADGKYAPCQGCFHCWTKHPAACGLKDSLHEICRVVGQADDLVVVTENWYGGYSPAVKNLMDRAIGTSTPMSTYRGGEMHHTLRYGKRGRRAVVVYGDVTEGEKQTWRLMVRRNAVNEGYREYDVSFASDMEELEAMAL